MSQIIAFIKDNSSLSKKIKSLFIDQHKQKRKKELIDQAVILYFTSKEKKRTGARLRSQLSPLLTNEILASKNPIRIITPILLFYAMVEDQDLFRLIIDIFCSDGYKYRKQLCRILNEFDLDALADIVTEMIFRCEVKKKMFSLFSPKVLENVFKRLYPKLIGIESLHQCTVEHLDKNMFVLYKILHNHVKTKHKKSTLPKISPDIWLPRVLEDPHKLNEFYQHAIEQKYDRQIFSITDPQKRMQLITKIRTPELSLTAKKKLFLENLMIDEYFIS